MIEHLRIRGFKRFVDDQFHFSPLTILAGVNGTGKTSLIHALLLAHEAWRRRDGLVELNGPFDLELGSFVDITNYEVGGEFSFRFTGGTNKADDFLFSGTEEQRFATVVMSDTRDTSVFSKAPRSFQYLSAERLGPRVTQSSAALPPQMIQVGCRGEYTAQVLDTLGSMLVDAGRVGDDGDSPPLLKPQAEQWLSRVTRPLQVDTESFPGTGSFALRFRVGEEWVKPTNMGFGVTYAIPVIVAGLTAALGAVLIVENPEAHLHPAGQSQMGVFLATMAASGVQVIVETHSDHVLNGARRAVAEHHILPASSTAVYHFDCSVAAPVRLSFTNGGGVSSWPPTFFDQYQLDVAALTRIRRPR